jgi:hypothetical protein
MNCLIPGLRKFINLFKEQENEETINDNLFIDAVRMQHRAHRRKGRISFVLAIGDGLGLSEYHLKCVAGIQAEYG